MKQALWSADGVFFLFLRLFRGEFDMFLLVMLLPVCLPSCIVPLTILLLTNAALF